MTTNGNGKSSGIRTATAISLLILVILVVLVDTFGRLLVDENFRVSDLMLGTLIGALLLVIGIDVSKRWPFNGGPK